MLTALATAPPQKTPTQLEAEAERKLGISWSHRNIGITGMSGAGKSSILNAIRLLGDDEADSANSISLNVPRIHVHTSIRNIPTCDYGTCQEVVLANINKINISSNKVLQEWII